MKGFFKAMGDPTRRQILEMLKDKDLTAGQISEAFHISKPSISYHLDLLKNADLVFASKQGQYIYYSLNTTVLDEVISWLMDLNQPKNKSEQKRKPL
ncbi:ArsR family transcriptional regulator [Catalinimonas alkaloidigena]|uniref:autorepressor SdpR family transcription factor n=1 Tax=Catalinimonas alkaloidigena TaxID=1075417 RepID=UPI0024056124|nr:autorepressor SdpR family transcription factor [Catalinimonas alkaloidigena]MDF9799642.1 ArsR family transcriptional regulator [Catalinimonas alkaloidigena]